MNLPITKFSLISNSFTSTFHLGCKNEIDFLLLQKKRNEKTHILSRLQNKNLRKKTLHFLFEFKLRGLCLVKIFFQKY